MFNGRKDIMSPMMICVGYSLWEVSIVSVYQFGTDQAFHFSLQIVVMLEVTYC